MKVCGGVFASCLIRQRSFLLPSLFVFCWPIVLQAAVDPLPQALRKFSYVLCPVTSEWNFSCLQQERKKQLNSCFHECASAWLIIDPLSYDFTTSSSSDIIMQGCNNNHGSSRKFWSETSSRQICKKRYPYLIWWNDMLSPCLTQIYWPHCCSTLVALHFESIKNVTAFVTPAFQHGWRNFCIVF